MDTILMAEICIMYFLMGMLAGPMLLIFYLTKIEEKTKEKK